MTIRILYSIHYFKLYARLLCKEDGINLNCLYTVFFTHTGMTSETRVNNVSSQVCSGVFSQ